MSGTNPFDFSSLNRTFFLQLLVGIIVTSLVTWGFSCVSSQPWPVIMVTTAALLGLLAIVVRVKSEGDWHKVVVPSVGIFAIWCVAVMTLYAIFTLHAVEAAGPTEKQKQLRTDMRVELVKLLKFHRDLGNSPPPSVKEFDDVKEGLILFAQKNLETVQFQILNLPPPKDFTTNLNDLGGNDMANQLEYWEKHLTQFIAEIR